MTEQYPDTQQYLTVRVDRAGLMRLPAADRFRACQSIRTPTTADQVDDIRAAAVLELVEEDGREHGANAAVGRIIGKSGTFVGTLVAEAEQGRESFEQTRARLDGEDVEDITGDPRARLRAMRSLETVVDTFLSPALDAAEADDFEAATTGVRMISSSVSDTLRIPLGETDEGRVAEARAIEEGTAPHQEHTYQVRMSYQDGSGAWVEHSVRGWEAANDFTIEEVAEDAGYLLTGLNERDGESTPGRVWQLELWADPTGTGAPDHVHEHTELAPTADDWKTWEILQQATDENGAVDTRKVHQLWAEHHTNQRGDKS